MKHNSMKFHRRHRQLLAGMGVVLILMSLVFQSDMIYGQDRVKPEWIMPRHYPNGFHGMGCIDRITEDQLVIDEHLLKLTHNVTYNTPTEEDASSAFFSPGKMVGYILNADNAIVSLWLIERERP